MAASREGSSEAPDRGRWGIFLSQNTLFVSFEFYTMCSHYLLKQTKSHANLRKVCVYTFICRVRPLDGIEGTSHFSGITWDGGEEGWGWWSGLMNSRGEKTNVSKFSKNRKR